MKRLLIAVSLLTATATAPPVLAQNLHPSNRDVNSGDFSEEFFTEVAQWHVTHSRNRQAVDVLVAQFPTIPEEFQKLTDKPQITPQDLKAFTSSCCQGSYEEEHRALIALASALIEGEGRYAVEEGAPKQNEKARKDTFRRAEKLREAILADASFYGPMYRQVMVNAITFELRAQNYPEGLRLLHANFPDAARLGTLKDAEIPAKLSELDEYAREAFLLGLTSMMASHGAVAWSGAQTKVPAEQKKNVDAAIRIYRSSKLQDLAMDASILESDPVRRNEYYRFVHEAAITGKFTNSRGWRHASIVYDELSKQAANAVDRIDPWMKPPEPSYDDQSCGD